MRQPTRFVVFALSAMLLPAAALAQTSPSARVLDLSFNNGTVTLVAKNVTVAEIMAEWARKGGSRVVNAEKLVGTPMSYEFQNMPEVTVLQSVLRSAAGYIAAPRRPGGPVGASTLEQVQILATSRPTQSSVTTMPANPMSNPIPIMGSPDDDIPPVVPERPTPQNPSQPQRPMTPTNQPQMGVGSSPTPGVIIAPVQSGVPVPPIIKK
jgi:hypothetical protein